MEARAAFERLGAEVDSDAMTLRRAYLRRLKKHPPDRDPDGFRELREAYELAAELVQMGIAAEVCEEEGRAPDEAEAAELFEESEDASFILLEDEEDEEDDYSAAFAPYAERLDRLEPEDLEGRLAILEEAIEAHPELPGPFEIFAHLAMGTEHEGRGIEVLRLGIERGHEACAGTLCQRYPQEAGREELVRWARRAGAWEVFMAASMWLQASPEAPALELVEAALEKVAEGGGGPYVATMLLGIFLELQAAGRLEESARVMAWVEEQIAIGAGRLGDHASSMLILGQELLALDASFPPELRAAIARATRAGDFEPAKEEVHALTKSSKSRSRQVAGMLRAYAPQIGALFEPLLIQPEDEGPGASKWGRFFLFLFLIHMLGVALRACTGNF